MIKYILLLLLPLILNAHPTHDWLTPVSVSQYSRDVLTKDLEQVTVTPSNLNEVYRRCKTDADFLTQQPSLNGEPPYIYDCVWLGDQALSVVDGHYLTNPGSWLMVRKFNGIHDNNGKPPRWNYDRPPVPSEVYHGLIADNLFFRRYRHSAGQCDGFNYAHVAMTRSEEGYCLPACTESVTSYKQHSTKVYTLPNATHNNVSSYYYGSNNKCKLTFNTYNERKLYCQYTYQMTWYGGTRWQVTNSIVNTSPHNSTSCKLGNEKMYYRNPFQFPKLDEEINPARNILSEQIDNLLISNQPPEPPIDDIVNPTPSPEPSIAPDPGQPTIPPGTEAPCPPNDPTCYPGPNTLPQGPGGEGREPTECEVTPGLPQCVGTGTESGDCAAPPICSIDNVHCAVLKQLWINKCDVPQSTASGGEQCDHPPVCTGDAVQCAILNQQWHSRCEYTKLNEGLDLTDPKYQPMETEEADLSQEITNITNQTPEFVSTCPADEVIETSIGQITIPYTSFCTLAGYLYYIVIMISVLIAVRNVANAVNSE